MDTSPAATRNARGTGQVGSTVRSGPCRLGRPDLQLGRSSLYYDCIDDLLIECRSSASQMVKSLLRGSAIQH